MTYAKNAARRGRTLTGTLAAATLASACGGTGPTIVDNPWRTERAAQDQAVARPEGYCVGWAEIRLEDASVDGLTEADAREILAHNLHGEKVGCW